MMSCDDINTQLKPFLEDLLTEEEYQAFLEHLDRCPKCKEYVRSFGSLSNQLWKLGDVPVPSDFVSTVLFRLKQPEGKNHKSQFDVFKKWFVGVIILILTVSTVFLGAHYLKSHQPPPKAGEESKTLMPEVKEENLSKDRARALTQKELDPIVITVEAPKKEGSIEEAFKETPSLQEEATFKKEPVEVSRAAIFQSRPLHWHFRYSQDLEKEKFLNTLNDSGVRLDYKEYNLFVFTTTGKKLEEVLEKIILTAQDKSALRDFTSIVPTLPDTEHRVSIYLENEKIPLLHWHVGLNLPHQKAQLLDVIQKSGGSLDYESEDLIVFSIQKTEVEKLKAKILAMRVGFSEFGKITAEENQLISKPIEISIYFSR